MPTVINFGSINIDHVYSVGHFVRPGETIASRKYETFAGGKGLNQSIAIARAGATVRHAGRIGADGVWLRDLLARNGVDVGAIEVADCATGHAIIQVNSDGENAILLHAGANHSVNVDHIARALGYAGDDDYVLVQNETSRVADVIRLASERGLRVAFNPAPMTDSVTSYPLAGVTLFIVNEVEGADLTGEKSVDGILGSMRDKYPDATTVLTLGARGAAMAIGDDVTRVPANEVDAVDTTGAGDTFIGYLLAGVVQGLSDRDALERAIKAAAISVTRPGAESSIPVASELER